MLVCKAGHRKI